MKYLYILGLALFNATFAIAQDSEEETQYADVLYRVNVGGDTLPSHDTFNVGWDDDDFFTPSPYSNYQETENKITTTNDTIIYDSSVPADVPLTVFKSERSIKSWDVTRMEWDFPVEEGKALDVRLYFAEIYFTETGDRVFDIEIDGNIVESNIDLIEEYGSDTGAVKTFTITSDGNVDIALIQNSGQPTISGIEILEIEEQETGVTGIASSFAMEKAVYPNPFTGSITIPNVTEPKNVIITDMSGHIVLQASNGAVTQNGLIINCSDLSKGMYILKVNGKANIIEKQ